MTNATAEMLANEIGVTYADVISFANAVASEMEKDNVSSIFADTQTPELLLAYLEPAIKTQERVRMFFQTNRSATQAFVMQIHTNLTSA